MKSKGQGWFEFLILTEWWETTFTEAEKLYILETYKPLGGSSEDLIKGDYSGWKTTLTSIALLTILAGYFLSHRDRRFAYIFLDKAENCVDDSTPILDLHFLYSRKIDVYYKDRNKDDTYFQTAIQACKEQINLAPKAGIEYLNQDYTDTLPSHLGYKQLAIVLEKQKDYESVINLCQQAQGQGWNGDWDKRIKRCEAKRIKGN